VPIIIINKPRYIGCLQYLKIPLVINCDSPVGNPNLVLTPKEIYPDISIIKPEIIRIMPSQANGLEKYIGSNSGFIAPVNAKSQGTKKDIFVIKNKTLFIGDFPIESSLLRAFLTPIIPKKIRKLINNIITKVCCIIIIGFFIYSLTP
jgi:hypothetical protein